MVEKQKRPYPAEWVINWYIGNFLESPSNAKRDEYFDPAVAAYAPAWKDDIERIKNEFKGKLITHSEFFKAMVTRGIHKKYYLYRKFSYSW